jgi:NTE family protein
VSWGRQTLTLHGEVKAANAASASTVGRYSLGGFQQLSGYQPGQVSGNAMVYGRLNWYMRLAETPVFARGFFVGTSIEAGNAWLDYHDLRLTGLRYGGSVFLGADTGLGPMYLGLTWAPRGEAGLALVIGRP